MESRAELVIYVALCCVVYMVFAVLVVTATAHLSNFYAENKIRDDSVFIPSPPAPADEIKNKEVDYTTVNESTFIYSYGADDRGGFYLKSIPQNMIFVEKWFGDEVSDE